jgi:hypothetical protein
VRCGRDVPAKKDIGQREVPVADANGNH